MTDDEKKERAEKIAASFIKGIIEGAADDDADDQATLGLAYKNGEYGLKQDDKQAVKWFKKSAAQGNAYGLYHLALCYADGIGVKRDWTQAEHYFTEAALAVESIEDNITLASRDAIKMLRESEYNEMLFFSIEFSKRLPKKREIYDMEAVKKFLSWDYERYFIVPQDYAKAIDEYRKAAEQNDVFALMRLGICYAAGLGVEKDWEQAKQYFATAVLADSKGDDMYTLDAKEAYKLFFDDGNKDKPFEEILREALKETRRVYQGGRL